MLNADNKLDSNYNVDRMFIDNIFESLDRKFGI